MKYLDELIADPAVNAADVDGGIAGEWYCEEHPWALQSHDGCGGAGVPACARIDLLVLQLKFANQKLREQAAIHAPIAEALLAEPLAIGGKPCRCMAKINEAMRPHNTQVSFSFSLSNSLRELWTIHTSQVETGRGKPKAKALFASFCPLCGESLKTVETGAK